MGIRLANKDDAIAIQAIYAPYVRDTAISFETEPPEPAEMASRIANVSLSFPWLVCEDSTGQVLGYAYAGRHRERAAYRWSVDVAVYIDHRAQRRGVGRGLYKSLLELLKLQHYCRAFAGITLPNEASIGLHEAVGFSLVGVYEDVGFKLGRWHAVAWFGFVLQQPAVNPQEPLAPGQLTHTDAWLTAIEAGESYLRL